jgi:hypothetical protein
MGAAVALVLGLGGGVLAVGLGQAAQTAGASSAPAVRYLAVTPRVMGAPTFTFTVNTTADTHDANPGDGVCADSGATVRSGRPSRRPTP